MKLTLAQQYDILNQAEKDGHAFIIDWKASVEDIVFNAKSILPNLMLESTPEKEVLGNWIEIMTIEGKEYSFNTQSETLIHDVIGKINMHLSKHNQSLVLIDPDDNYCFILIKLEELPEYIEKGFLEV